MKKMELKRNVRALLISVTGFLCLQIFSSSLLAAPGDILFNEDFERAALGADWTVATGGGGDAGISTQTANSGSRSLFTRWALVSVTSRSFDLSTIGGAQLAIWVRRGDDAFSEDPEIAGSEDLVVEYLDDVGGWQQLARYVGGGTPGEIFTPTFFLPANALHAGFQVRFTQTGGNGSDWDYWHVDDVVLTETAGLPTLAFPFCDDFESGMSNWQVSTSGGDASIGNNTFNSASNSLNLRWGVASVTSLDIDLSAVPTAYFNFWLRRGSDSFSEDPDNNENVTVEYFDNTGTWIVLETFSGNGSPGEIFNRSFALPPIALHSAFKVRFSTTGGSGSDFDYWHLDDVCIEGPPSSLALYHLDEASWGAVTDSTGNGNDGSVVGGVVPNSISPAVVGDPGTCGYADIPFNNSNNIYDAIDTGIDVDNDIGNVGSVDFWYKSNANWNGNNGDRQLLDASTTSSGQKYFFLTLRNNSRLRFGLEDSSDGDFTIQGGNNNFAAGVWVHIAVTWDLPNDRLQLYVNGSLDTENTFGTNGVMGNMDTLYVGDNRSTYQVGGMTGNSANGSVDEINVYDFVLSQAQVQNDMNATHSCSGLDHFVVSHDSLGISCLAEPITVTAERIDGSIFTGYTGTMTLDTQSGNGTWTLNTGNGVFNDATADDGLATYTFDPADNGMAIFNLDYQSGTGSINVDTFEGAIRDDDTDVNLVFSPFGITVTDTPLSNPPPDPINTLIPAKIAASSFPLYLAAYGQTTPLNPADPVCGIIESYTGNQNINFWSGYTDPISGTLQVAVNGSNVATTELASVPQVVAFTNGQASITVNYPDVGLIGLTMKDVTTGNPDLDLDPVAGIDGSTSFVVKPNGFVLSNIQRTSDAFPNPGTAVDETGAAFMAAGDDFSVTVTAVNLLGNTTPNYGQEITPESVLLTSTLVAAGGANNPVIGSTVGFNSFVNGVDTGTDFNWSEVGIITLTPSVADADYLGAGNVTGTVSANVGRFYPDHFVTAFTNGSFTNTCATGTPFTYLGESFGYLGSPTVTATAESALNTTTLNYTGPWARLTTGGVSLTYPAADGTQVDQNGVTPINVTSTVGLPGRVDNADGSLTFTLGGSTADSYAYDRSLGQIAPFAADLTIQLTAVTDGEAAASDLAVPKNISPLGNLQRFGFGFAQDAYGTTGQTGDSLTVPIGAVFFDAGGVWTFNTDDSCSIYAYAKIDTGITTAASSLSPVSLANGGGNLTLTITAGVNGGTSVVNTVWPAWLQYDFDGVDQLLDGNFYDDDASATATFGIFRGNDRYLYWREAP